MAWVVDTSVVVDLVTGDPQFEAAFAGRFQGTIMRNATDFRNILPTLTVIEP